jgi:rRNA processing protein Gar1
VVKTDITTSLIRSGQSNTVVREILEQIPEWIALVMLEHRVKNLADTINAQLVELRQTNFLCSDKEWEQIVDKLEVGVLVSSLDRIGELADFFCRVIRAYGMTAAEDAREDARRLHAETDVFVEEKKYDQLCSSLNITKSVTASTAPDCCAFCYGNELGDIPRVVCCDRTNHVYCLVCFYNWFKINPKNCALCQKPFEWSDSRLIVGS